MTVSNNAVWKRIFGEAWDMVSKICPEIGMFLIDHKNRKVILDDNSLKLADADKVPDYDTMIGLLDILSQDSATFSRLAPQVAYQDDDYTAGILRWHYNFSGVQPKMVVPMLEMPQLVLAISQCQTPSLLVLLEFNLSDHRQLEEYHLFGALSAIARILPDGGVFCPSYKNGFWLFIPEFSGDAEALLKNAQDIVMNSGQAARLGEMTAERFITFTAGIGAGEGTSASRMNTAEYALYEAHSIGDGSIVNYSLEHYERDKQEYEKMSRFLKLVNENLFLYHFQPIVSAKNGDIVAYELLMRTDSSIGMFPLEILDCAEKTNRLYDIEKATMSNALAIIEKNQDTFKKRRLFVNSITAHMLTDEDWDELYNRYGELMEKMVIEFTEQSELDAMRIDNVKNRLVRAKTKIAIDDFGTGYSNTMNLIRYSPDFVKIDRSLISGIDTKPTLRKLVSGIIEFIHENGYQALAEGVETYEELQTMIQLGSDLIQGYYISKPKPIMLYEVADSVCRDIETINLINTGGISRPYHPEEGETVDICLVRGDRYNSIFIETENVTLKGRSDLYIDTQIIVKDGLNCVITLENVHIKTEKDVPIISLGEDSDVEIILSGVNELNGRGVYVPASSALYIIGEDGCELNIASQREDCYAIGTDSKSSYGKITIDTRGKIKIDANGNTVMAIGGGRNENKVPIRLLGGEVSMICTGGACIGVGALDGGAIVDIENCTVNIDLSAPDIVGIGSLGGDVDINMKNFNLNEELKGISVAGVGAVSEGTGRVEMSQGIVDGTFKGRIVSCIGTRNGGINCHTKQSFITLYCESGSVSGIGDMLGAGDVTLEETRLDFDFHTGNGMAYGSRSGVLKRIEPDEDIKINV